MKQAVVAASLLMVLLIAGCKGSPSPPSPTPTPTPTPVAACVTNNTASVRFANNSPNAQYNVIWDGFQWTTLGLKVTSQYYEVQAGVAHTLIFRFTHNNQNACTPANPVPLQCNSYTYSCDYQNW